jgi:hypothetical protein
VLATLLVAVPLACDDEKGDSGGDDVADPSGSEEGSGEEEQGVEACVDGEQMVAVGEDRACECMDGSQSTQTCLSTGEFGTCDCAGW